MPDKTIGSFPIQVHANVSHLSGGNITPVSEAPIGASLLWAFLLTATHNITFSEHSTLPAGLEPSKPDTTTLVSNQVDFLKYSNGLPQESAASPAMPGGNVAKELSGESGRTGGQGQSSLMASLTPVHEGGTTLLAGNTMQLSGNGRLLTEPKTIVRVTPEPFGGSSTIYEPSDESEGLLEPFRGSEASPEQLLVSLVVPEPSDKTEGLTEPSPEPPTAALVAPEPSHETEGLTEPSPEPITTSLVAPEPSDETEGSSEPSSEPFTVFLVAPEPSDETEGSSEPSSKPLTASLLAPETSDDAEGSPEPSPEPFMVSSLVPEPSKKAKDSSKLTPESLMAALVAPEPFLETEGSSEPLSEALTASSVVPEPSNGVEDSQEPWPEPLTASSGAQNEATLSSVTQRPVEGSAGPQQATEEGYSQSLVLQSSLASSAISEAISVAYEVSASHETNITLNDTVEAEEVTPSGGSGIEWSTFKAVMFVVQLVIMVETVIGNLMVILSVKIEKKLQTPFNYYIVNLAFTDMNVGLSVMSLFMISNLYEYFPFSAPLCHYWVWSDYTMTFESVMTLAAISLDRLWSVTWSLHYRNHNSGRKSLYIILGTWCLVAVIWLPPFVYDRIVNVYPAGECYWDTVLNKNLVVYVGFLGYYTPLLVMLGAYAKILLVVRKRAASIRDAGRKPSIQADHSSSGGGGDGGDQKRLVAAAPATTQAKDDKQEAKLKREMKAVYTLLNIVVIFLLCWVPFYILFVLSAWFPSLFPTWYVTFSYWMAYINSAVNPVLYPLSSPEFRQAYKKVILTVIGRS